MKFPAMLKYGLSYAMTLIVASACWADDAASPSSMEIIQFTSPTGWQMAEKPGQAVRIFTSPDSDASQQAVILVLLSPTKEGLNLRNSFDEAIKSFTSEGKVLQSAEPSSTKTRQGFEALSQTLVTQGQGDQRLYVRAVGANVENRFAAFFFIANKEDLYNKHQGDMDDLLKSVSFKATLGGAPAAVAPAAMPADGKAGDAPPAGDGEKLLAKAKEQFGKDLAQRRKPHTILGDILTLDGKPIPNAVPYSAFVWGITNAGEKLRLLFAVDAKGHYEQKIPDGLYQIRVTCLVDYGGHRVPIDLVWLDDKEGIDQASDEGIVRDFRMVMTGLKPGGDPKRDDAFFGGAFKANGPVYQPSIGSFSQRHDGGKVLFTLTPQGPLIDGTRGEVLTLDYPTTDLDYGSFRRNLPIGVYRVTVMLVDKNGTKRRLGVTREFGKDYLEWVDISWESSTRNKEDRVDPTVYITD